jgi:REP element-mobilizing transposase RayT
MYDPEIHHRRSIRMRGYDYAQPGAYFVTVCTQDNRHLFGDVVEGQMRLNESGETVRACWLWLAKRYSHVELDEWIVMPNHIHAIVRIHDRRGGSGTAPGGASRCAPTKPLGRLIGAFKTVSTKRFNEIRGTPGTVVWQRNYYEHIIRNEDECEKIREYVRRNPLLWACDRYNPERSVAVIDETGRVVPWEM